MGVLWPTLALGYIVLFGDEVFGWGKSDLYIRQESAMLINNS